MATYKVQKDGKAPSGLKAGDVVVTGGGTFTIQGVNADGSYNSVSTDKNTTTNNYKGSYANVGSSSSGSSSSGGSSSSSASSSNTSSYYSPTGGGGSSGSVGQYAGTNYHQDAIDAAKAGDWGAVKVALDAREEKVGQTGENYGKTSGDIYSELWQLYGEKPSSSFTYSDSPSYSDPYDPTIDKTLDSILNRDKFSYDATTDPLYEQYKDQYLLDGQRAMQDTLGQVSARTGGLASSYANSVAQQTNQLYAQQLADKIPELYQLAYQMYLDDIDLKVQDLGLLQNASNTAYNRYRDTMADWRSDRDFAYGQYRDDIADNRYDTEWNYGVGRDKLEDERYDNNLAYQKAADMLSSGVMPDEAMLKQAGISSQQAAAWLASQTVANRGYGGGGGGGGRDLEKDADLPQYSEQEQKSALSILDKAAATGGIISRDTYLILSSMGLTKNMLEKDYGVQIEQMEFGGYGKALERQIHTGHITLETLQAEMDQGKAKGVLTEEEESWLLSILMEQAI